MKTTTFTTASLIMGAFALLLGSVQAQSPYVTDGNTLILYHFDESSGASTAVDASGNNYDAVYGSLATSGLTSMTNMGNAAQTASSLNGRITFTDTANPTPNGQNSFLYNLSAGDFTLEAWVKPNADFFTDFTSGNRPIVLIQPSGKPFVDLQLSVHAGSGEYTLALGDSTGPNRIWAYTAPLNWVADEWYHVAVTGAASATPGKWDYKFYNSTPGGSTTPTPIFTSLNSGVQMVPQSTYDETRTLEVGNFYGANGNAYLPGLIDEVRLSNIARTEFQTIPEPTTLVLLGMGFLALAAQRRRRRN